MNKVVYHSISSSNHNYFVTKSEIAKVVYHSISSSNHNHSAWHSVCKLLYIILFHHQTTTVMAEIVCVCGCISFYFIIKPQRQVRQLNNNRCCISFYFIIKPQLIWMVFSCRSVVYHSISSSNHNGNVGWDADHWVVYHSISSSNHNT